MTTVEFLEPLCVLSVFVVNFSEFNLWKLEQSK
jgi:hypothetical protein